MDRSLVRKTEQVIASISSMDTIKSYVLVGGTALSLQISHRLSEDLDFMRWQKHKTEKMNVDISRIQKELKINHTIDKLDILEFNHVEFYIDGGVKLSFYAPEKKEPVIKTLPYLNNLRLADIDTIASLKMETMLRRTLFRDYYDLYCILRTKQPSEIKDIIDNALKYSGHHLRTKNLLGMLINSDRFFNDSSFGQLNPKYAITAKEIETFMIEKLRDIYSLDQ